LQFRLGARIAGGLRIGAAVLAAVLVASCGGGGGGGGDGGGAPAGTDYYPLGLGDRWAYSDVGSGAVTNLRVVGTRDVGGQSATVVRAVDADGVVGEVLYVKSASGVSVVPAPGADPAEQAFAAVPLLRFPIVAGETREELNRSFPGYADFDGDGLAEALVLHVQTLVVGFESLGLATGNWTDTAHVRTTLTQSTTLSSNRETISVATVYDDWYAPAVGPVRSTIKVSGGGVSESAEQRLFAYRVGTRRSESVAPTIATKLPAEGTEGRNAVVSVRFSEPMDRLGDGSPGFTLTGPDGQPVAGQLFWTGSSSFDFVANAFVLSGSYTARLDGLAEDLAGNALAGPAAWSFVVDGLGPTTVAVEPAAGAIEVPLDSVVRITFDEEIDPATVYPGTFTLREGLSTTVAATVALDGRVVTITPLQPLRPGRTYEISANYGFTDRLGNPSGGFTSRFKSDPGMFAAPAPLIEASVFVDALVLADLNGDGRLDVALSSDGYGDPVRRLRVLLQRADGGGFEAPVVLDTGIGCTTTSLSAADANGDGRADLVVGTYCGVAMLRQTASGTLGPALVLPSTMATPLVRQLQIAADGRLGVVANDFDGRLWLWRQTAPGSYAAPVPLPDVLHGISDIAVADVDGDGRPDLVASGQLASTNGSGIAVLHQLADGSFGGAQEIVVDLNWWGAAGIDAADLNGDGRVDIAFSTGGNSPTVIGLVHQAPDGSWGPVTTMSTYDIPSALRIADLNGDGRADVVVSHRGWLAMSVYLQRADGTLAPELLFESVYESAGLQTLALGDVTGDGRIDIVSSTVVLRQRVVPSSGLGAGERRRTLTVPRLAAGARR
jgi:hypothetical protein